MGTPENNYVAKVGHSLLCSCEEFLDRFLGAMELRVKDGVKDGHPDLLLILTGATAYQCCRRASIGHAVIGSFALALLGRTDVWRQTQFLLLHRLGQHGHAPWAYNPCQEWRRRPATGKVKAGQVPSLIGEGQTVPPKTATAG